MVVYYHKMEPKALVSVGAAYPRGLGVLVRNTKIIRLTTIAESREIMGCYGDESDAYLGGHSEGGGDTPRNLACIEFCGNFLH